VAKFTPTELQKTLLKRVRAVTKIVRNEALEELKGNTPVLSGKAQRGWVKKGGKIINETPYINVLEFGFKGRPPHGMRAKLLQNIDNIVSDAIDKVDDNA